jgi:carbon storage regulator CsrA
MLVLSRKAWESVVVGGGFEKLLRVTVLEIKHGSVRLGFEAGPDLAVRPSEPWERLRALGQPRIPMDGPAATMAG